MGVLKWPPAPRTWALLSGLALWLSFPNPWALGFEAWTGRLAWAALVPLFIALRGQPPAQALRLGYLFGLAFFVPALAWLTNVHPLGPGAYPAWLALAAWCALFPALFAAALSWGQQRRWPLPLLWVPALWVLSERLRETALSGFPWVSLGSSQAVVPELSPLAGALGLDGLHYAVAFINACLFAAAVHPAWAQGWRRSVSALAMGVALFGLAHYERQQQAAFVQAPAAGPTLKVAVVQGGIDMDQLWDQAFRSQVIQRYLGLSREAVAQGAELLIWPECAFPGFFNEPSAEAQSLRELVRREKVPVLFGSTLSEGNAYTNSAILLRPDGQVERYTKTHLVPFGEYVPFRRWVPLLDLALERMGVANFEAGSSWSRFQVKGLSIAPLICYEGIFPSLLAAGPAPDLVAVLTVDTWYGRSAGPVWHALQARLRAVESGAQVARAASTGISLFATADGHSSGHIALQSQGFSLSQAGPARPTLARRWAPWVWRLCLLGALGLALIWRRASQS